MEENSADEAELNAQHLVSRACGFERKYLFLNLEKEVSQKEIKKTNIFLSLKIKGYPLSWILKDHDFCGLKIKIRPGVFVPRPETEELACIVSKESLKMKNPKILDFCCGSGCIGLYAAYKNPKSFVYAFDISAKAVSCSNENAKLLGLKNYKAKKKGRLSSLKKFDILVSNPPYIPSSLIKSLDHEVRIEPKKALDGGSDGLDMIRYIEKKAFLILKKGGKIYLEFSDGQAKEIKKMFEKRYRKVKIIKDLQGKERFLEAYNG